MCDKYTLNVYEHANNLLTIVWYNFKKKYWKTRFIFLFFQMSIAFQQATVIFYKLI